MPFGPLHHCHSQTSVTQQEPDSFGTGETGRDSGRRCLATTTASPAAPAPTCSTVCRVELPSTHDEELFCNPGDRGDVTAIDTVCTATDTVCTATDTVCTATDTVCTATDIVCTDTATAQDDSQPSTQEPCTVSAVSDVFSESGEYRVEGKETLSFRHGAHHHQLQQRHLQQHHQRFEHPHHPYQRFSREQHQQTRDLHHHQHPQQQQQLHYALGVPVEYGRARRDSLSSQDHLELRLEHLATRHQGQQLELTQQEVDELLEQTARCCGHQERLQNVRQARNFMVQLQHIFGQHGLLGRGCQTQSESDGRDLTAEQAERARGQSRRAAESASTPRPQHQLQPREIPAVTSLLQRLPFQVQLTPVSAPTAQPADDEDDVYHDNNPDTFYPTKHYPLPPGFQTGCEEHWSWNSTDKSHEVRLCGPRNVTAFFHPNWSNGTAGVRGNRPLNGGVHFWEVRVASRIFGTSMMFGVGTKRARLHVDSFVNMLGEDEAGWGLSHKGLLWHVGRSRPYASPFKENVATVVGVLFDGLQGTLTFYKDGQSLGPAFTDLDKIEEDLFPIVCSTAAKTEMTLGARRRAYLSLQDRSRASIVTSLPSDKKSASDAVMKLPLPNPLRQYLLEQVTSNAL